MRGSLLGLFDEILALVATALMPAGTCEADACDALRAVCGSCRAFRALFAETRAFAGAYVVTDSPRGTVDERALGARVARDFAFFPRMSTLISSSPVSADVGSMLLDTSRAENVHWRASPVVGLVVGAMGASRHGAARPRVVARHVLPTCVFREPADSCARSVAGLDELELDSLTVDFLAFYVGRCGGYVGPVVGVGPEFLAPLWRARKVSVRRTPAPEATFTLSCKKKRSSRTQRIKTGTEKWQTMSALSASIRVPSLLARDARVAGPSRIPNASSLGPSRSGSIEATKRGSSARRASRSLPARWRLPLLVHGETWSRKTEARSCSLPLRFGEAAGTRLRRALGTLLSRRTGMSSEIGTRIRFKA